MKITIITFFAILSLNIYAQSFDIGEEFIASGYMGDTDNIEMFSAHREKPQSPPLCFMIRYIPGAKGWAGIYWQNSPDNWGDTVGANFSDNNFNKITFWAKGETGNEIIEFKSGGISGKQYEDSYSSKTTPRRTALTKDWVKYEINLEGLDLSSVIGGFAWVASAKDNPNGVTFYLDDINFIRE